MTVSVVGPITTTSAAAVELFAADNTTVYYRLYLFNGSKSHALFSIDSGVTWRLLLAESERLIKESINNAQILIKRVGVFDLGDIYAEIDAQPLESAVQTYRETVVIWEAAATSTSKTLHTLKGTSLVTNLKEIILAQNDTSEVANMAIGTASGTSAVLPVNGLSLPISKRLASTFELFSTAGADITIIELG